MRDKSTDKCTCRHLHACLEKKKHVHSKKLLGQFLAKYASLPIKFGIKICRENSHLFQHKILPNLNPVSKCKFLLKVDVCIHRFYVSLRVSRDDFLRIFGHRKKWRESKRIRDIFDKNAPAEDVSGISNRYRLN